MNKNIECFDIYHDWDSSKSTEICFAFLARAIVNTERTIKRATGGQNDAIMICEHGQKIDFELAN